MGFTLLFESMTAAASVGMGCGTCCGSGISAALYGYLTTHVRNIKQSLRAFLDFFLGKFLAVILLCCVASVIGENIIDDSGRLFGIKIGLIADAGMLVLGFWLLFGWIRERQGNKGCKSCSGCNDTDKPIDKTTHAALIGMGFGYGISPCAPLIIIIGYAATLPLGFAALLGTVFAGASILSPMLFILLISGILSGKMYKEIPQYITWFKLGCYILLIALFAISLYKEVIVL